MTRGQAEHLMPMLDQTLAEAGVAWGDLDAIGVGVGPGNFTGIRISVAAARGLALSLGIPAIGVSGFEALALGRKPPFWCVIDARRGHVHVCHQGPTPGVPIQMTADEATRLVGTKIARTDMPTDLFVTNIAHIAATRADRPQPRPAPLYIRPPDAAPSAVPAPTILRP